MLKETMVALFFFLEANDLLFLCSPYPYVKDRVVFLPKEKGQHFSNSLLLLIRTAGIPRKVSMVL